MEISSKMLNFSRALDFRAFQGFANLCENKVLTKLSVLH